LLVTPNLKAYYRMEGNANDASGNGNNGTVYGASLYPYENLVLNGGFETWSAGGNSDPDYWTNVRTSEREDTIVQEGDYSFKIINSHAEYRDGAYQDFIGDVEFWQGKTVTIKGWVKADTSGTSIRIWDSEGQAVVSHTGGGEWEYLSVSRTIDSNATYVRARLMVDPQETSYFDAVVVTEDNPDTKFGRCYSFDGSDDYIDIPSINMGDQYTILSWVKPTATTNLYPQLMGKEYVISIRAEEGVPIRFITGGGSSWDGTWKEANTNLSVDTWQHIAIRVDQTDIDFFLNGEADGSDTRTNRSWNSGFYIGKRKGQTNADYNYEGLGDEFMIFNKALSQPDIKRVMMGLHPIGG